MCLCVYSKTMADLEQPHQFVQIFCLFYKKNLTFSILHICFYKILTSIYLFYTFIQLNIHSFTFFYYFLTHGLSLSLSLSKPTTVIITQPPSSKNPDLSDPSFVIFSFLILMVDRSRNPNQVET